MEQKVIRKKIIGIGVIEVSIVLNGNKWWSDQIEEFITGGEHCFVTIASLNKKFQSNVSLQSAIQLFVNHIQSGGEPQAANKIRNHFNNWLNKTNGVIGTESGFKANGGGLSGTTIIRPDKTYDGVL